MTEATRSAKQRLAESRRALSRQMLRQDRRHGLPDQPGGADGARSGSSGGPLPLLRHALSLWWQRHPAHNVWLVGRPVLEHYAGQKPLQVLGIAAGIGALAVLLRPWRAASLAKIGAAALGSAEVSGLLRTFLSTAGRAGERDRP